MESWLPSCVPAGTSLRKKAINTQRMARIWLSRKLLGKNQLWNCPTSRCLVMWDHKFLII